MESTYKQTGARVHLHTETATDYTLADYQGDIKKVLLTEAKLLPGTEFLTEGEGQLSGSVLYDIVYADTEGMMCSVQLTSEYEMTAAAPECAEDMMSRLRIGGITVRPVGPRKLSAKATVSADVCFLVSASVTSEGDGMERDPALRLSEHAVRNTVCGHSDDRVYTDTVLLEGADGEHTEILLTSAVPNIHDLTAEDGQVHFCVDMVMQALLRMEDGSVQCVRRAVTADETVSISQMSASMCPAVRAATPTVIGVIQTDAEGQVELQLTAHTSYTVCAEDNIPVTLVEDGYLCDYETDNTYADLRYEEFLDMQNLRTSFEGVIEGDAWEGDPLREIVYTTATLKTLRTEQTVGADPVCEGEVQICAIGVCADEEGRTSYAPVRMTVPFSCALPRGAYAGDTVVEAEGQVLAAECVLDEGRILLHGDVVVNATRTACRTARYLSHMQICKDIPTSRDASVITVYYPQKGEDLWDIARAYRTTVETLAQDNGLDVAVSASGTPVVLPERLLIF